MTESVTRPGARRARRAAAGRRSRSPPTATPRRTATSRSPRRRACGCAGRWRARPGGRLMAAVRRAGPARGRALPPAQREVAHGDRRREAVVEALGDAEAARGRRPSRPCSIANWWARSLRAWKSPSRSTWRSGARTAPGTPPAGTRARAKGCPSAPRPRGASVSTLGVETYATPPRPIRSRRRSSTASGSCTCSIVCRNTTQSHVARPVSIMSRSKRQPGPRVLQPRVLEGLRVGVHADHGRRRARQHRAAVALAAGEVDDAAAVRARRDPLVDDEVAAVPVVLLRHVGQRALAREVERRDARRAGRAGRRARAPCAGANRSRPRARRPAPVTAR